MQAFKKFLNEYNLPDSWPPTLQQLVQFIAHLSKFKKCSFSTINAYLSGISFFLKLNNSQDYTRAFIIQKMLCGLRRIRPVKDTRMPITVDILRKILYVLPFVVSSNYEARLFHATFVITFFGFLRIDEIAVTGKYGNCENVPHVSDLTLSENTCTLCIKSSKTDQYGNSVSLVFTTCSDSAICPVQGVKRYVRVRPQINGPLFCHFSGEPLTKYQFRSILLKCLKFAGIKANIKSHSFRIGAATLASMQNVPDEVIKLMGRWSTRGNTHRRYIRLDQLTI